MGTNYYHRTGVCGSCGRYDETHICKSMHSFEAVTMLDKTPPVWETVVVVGSWHDWKVRLRASGEVWDEYGNQFTVEEFISMVESTRLDRRRWQYDWMCSNLPGEVSDGPEPGKSWLDPDGFSFSGRPFS